MNDYIIIQTESAKTKLKSAQSKTNMYTIRFGNDREIDMTHFIESWAATRSQTYRGRDSLACWLRWIYEDVTPDEIRDFFRVFKRDHPLEEVEYSFGDIPLIAKGKQCCEINLDIFKEPILLTEWQEKELLKILVTPLRWRSKFEEMVDWFTGYCNTYGYSARLKRDRSRQSEVLAYNFCHCHGIDAVELQGMSLYNVPPKEKTTKEKLIEFKNGLLGVLLAIVVLSLYLMAAAGFFIIIPDCIDNGFLSAISMIIGVTMVFGPISMLFK